MYLTVIYPWTVNPEVTVNQRRGVLVWLAGHLWGKWVLMAAAQQAFVSLSFDQTLYAGSHMPNPVHRCALVLTARVSCLLSFTELTFKKKKRLGSHSKLWFLLDPHEKTSGSPVLVATRPTQRPVPNNVPIVHGLHRSSPQYRLPPASLPLFISTWFWRALTFVT